MHPRNDLGGTTALMITAINDKITPIITPYIVPNKSTPNIAARNMKNSALCGVVDGKEVTMQVKPGDKVIYSKYAGTEVKLDDEEYIVVKQNDILAVI